MYKSRFITFIAVLILSLALVGMAVAADTAQKDSPPEAVTFTGTAGSAGEGSSPEDISGSFADWDYGTYGDMCASGGTDYLCFTYHVESYTYAWPYGFQMKLPGGWNATNGYLLDNWSCTSSGYPGTLYFTGGNEPIFSQTWYLGSSGDECEAVYCIDVTTGGPDEIPWYIDSDGYGGGVVDTCDNTGYYSCDEAVMPPAFVPSCEPGIYLSPESQSGSACEGETADYTLNLFNNSGADNTFALSYDSNWPISGPADIFVANGATGEFSVTVTVPCGGVEDTATVTAVGGGYSDSSTLTTSASAGGWVEEPASPSVTMDNPVISYDDKLYVVDGYGSYGAVQIFDGTSWTSGASSGKNGYVVDACLGLNGAGAPVIDLLGDTTTFFTMERYEIMADAWSFPAIPAPMPSTGLWAPDIVSMYQHTGENVCYISGGATVPGGGNMSALYAYYPDTMTAMDLGDFTYLAGGFDFHFSWFVPWIGADGAICVAGGMNAASLPSGDTQCYDIAAGVFNAVNADLGPLPQPWWGGGDAWKENGSMYELWGVNGVDAAGALLQASFYFDGTGFVYGPPPLYPVYRMEAENYDGSIWAANGSTGGFTPSNLEEYLLICEECAPLSILLVDDDDNSPDVLPFYTDALDYLGLSYTIWDTLNSDNEPDAAYLAGFDAVIWFSGDEFGDFAGPGDAGEAALAEWLGGVVGSTATGLTPGLSVEVDKTIGVPNVGTPATSGVVVPFGGTNALLDDFNRDDGPIGPDWTVHEGFCNVVSNAAACGSLGVATFNDAPGDGTFAEIDVAVNSTSLEYNGLALNYAGVGSNFPFLKVQNQDGDMLFEYGACYMNNSGTPFGLGFYPLTSPFATAHMSATRVGDTVTVEFTNIDDGAQPDQTYVCTGAPAIQGTAIGIVGYGGIGLMDNFGGPGEGPEPVEACLLLSSQDYLYDNGLTSFGMEYLGIMDYDNDAGDYISVTGDGSVFTGLGPYTLDYPGSDYADVITPTATAENAFIGDNANVGAIDKFGATYFTNFAAFGYDAIVDVVDRADVISAVLSQCGGGLPPTEPEIEVTPTALESTQMPDTQVTQQLEICNVGTADLDWSITEVPGMKVTGARTETVEPAKPTHQVELSLEANGTSLPSAPAPAVPEDAVALVLDDGTRDNDIGIGGTWEMLWVNRFTPDPSEFPFNLNEVWIYFSSVGMVNVGDEIEIVIFENTTGGVDPAPGSNLLGTYFATVQALDTWNVYTLPAPVTFNGPGDAVIGAIGLEVPGTSYWPASIDQTTTQQRSWAGWYLTSPPPEPPFLPPDDTWLLIDSAGFAGNWMVRGYGETIGSDIPWLSEVPTMGTVIPGACTIVDVTFDSTGLAPDTYLGTLNVDSNDADEPTVPVGVTLNVVNPPDIVVDPTELSSTLFPDQTETQDLDVCNLGGETLTWELVETEYPNGTMEVLYDNGPQVTHPGGGFGGADASALQTALGLNTYGFGNQFLNGYRMADDFEITDPAGWNVQQITFFAYQTGSPTNPSTITGIYFQIWDGPPDDPTSTVVFGDLVTNRLANTTWSDIYRVLDTNLLNTDRPSMANTANAGVILPPGTYWLDWLTDGSLASGPWAPPISILGQTTTGNAMQYTTAWAPALDTGLLTQQGLPFVIEGQVVPSFDLEWLSEVPTSGDVLPGECETIAVTFDSTGLAVGTYTGALEFSSNDPDGAVVVPVTLEVLPFNPDVVVDPTSLALTLYPNETGLLNFTIGNVGDADLTWSLVDTGDWLTLDPIAGTVVPAGETMVDVMFDSTGLAAGTYNATVTITTNDPDEPTVTVNVTLTVVYRTFFLPVIYKTP